MRTGIILTIALFALSLLSCSQTTRREQAGGDTLSLAYARNICIVQHDGYTTVDLSDPWKSGRTLHRYVLVPRESDLPSPLPEGTLIRTPLSRTIVFTTVHCALLRELGVGESIAGVCDLKYIKDSWIQSQCQSGKIVNCGDGMAPDVERIIDTRPDALLLTPFENSGGYGKVEETGVPLIECAEYMEPTALGRAEWMRFYGRLLGQADRADSLFAAIDSTYADTKRKASERSRAIGRKPRVMMDKVTGSVWYVPGGQSTMAQLLSDAGGDYIFADNDQAGSVALSFETVLNRASDADVWLYRYSNRADLLSEHRGYAQFKPFRTGNVWGCDVSRSRFYEETPFHPEWLLKEFSAIIQSTADSTRYFFKLEGKR